MPHNETLINLKFLIEAGIYEFMEDRPFIYYHKIKETKPHNEKEKKAIAANLNNIKTLVDLKNAVNNFENCNLKNIAKNTVFADGNPKSKIMLIGEAPGVEEDKQGIPFVGRAGQLLNKMLESIGLDRSTVYITNILPWRPPGNRRPTNSEILLCFPFIQRHIEIINPEILILLGGTATKAILISDDGIMRLRGRWHEYNSYGLASPIATRAIFHPAFLLRSPGYKRQTWNDLKEVKIKLSK